MTTQFSLQKLFVLTGVAAVVWYLAPQFGIGLVELLAITAFYLAGAVVVRAIKFRSP